MERCSVETERREQRRWRFKTGVPPSPAFDQLVESEFLPVERQADRQDKALRQLLAFAGQQVPYYRDLFQRLGLKPDFKEPRAALAKLPLLSKRLILEQGGALHAERLPSGEKPFGIFSSSGTTGRPTRVLHTVRSNFMFTLMGQRHVRWSRWDPMDRIAEIRIPHQLPKKPDGSELPPGETCRLPQWRYLGHYFETGPYVALSVFTPLEQRLAWLAREQPARLTAVSEILEQLAFASLDRPPPAGLKSLRAISEQLTEPMRRRITEAFKVPIDQNYGLNEVGIIAGRCAAGRYHINSEHCLVEILDEDLQPCPPGKVGRLVVTGLANLAMPLIRYDTDDMARAVQGDCPCGRTLPGFDDIVGRYSRIVLLPPGTLRHVEALRDEMQAMPLELVRNLRQFQIHQFRDNRFEMRLCTVGKLPEAFGARIAAAWAASLGDENWPLRLVEVDEIERPPSGKYQDFTSDFMPGLSGPGEESAGGAG
jgi:phenylacetate-CoA ligase